MMLLLSLISLRAEVLRGGSGCEVAGEYGLDEGAENNLGASSLGKSHPEDKNELECVVERKPIDSIDCALKEGQECVDDPVSKPLSIVGRLGGKQRIKRVVCRNGKADGVDQKVGRNVEEDEEEVEGSEAKDNVNFGHAGLLLEIVESRVLAKLLIELRDGVLSAVLERHFEELGNC